MSFTWIPLYRAISRKVLEFENRQDELLAMIQEMRRHGLKTISLMDRDPQGVIGRCAKSIRSPFSQTSIGCASQTGDAQFSR